MVKESITREFHPRECGFQEVRFEDLPSGAVARTLDQYTCPQQAVILIGWDIDGTLKRDSGFHFLNLHLDPETKASIYGRAAELQATGMPHGDAVYKSFLEFSATLPPDDPRRYTLENIRSFAKNEGPHFYPGVLPDGNDPGIIERIRSYIHKKSGGKINCLNIGATTTPLALSGHLPVTSQFDAICCSGLEVDETGHGVKLSQPLSGKGKKALLEQSMQGGAVQIAMNRQGEFCYIHGNIHGEETSRDHIIPAEQTWFIADGATDPLKDLQDIGGHSIGVYEVMPDGNIPESAQKLRDDQGIAIYPADYRPDSSLEQAIYKSLDPVIEKMMKQLDALERLGPQPRLGQVIGPRGRPFAIPAPILPNIESLTRSVK